MCSKFRIFDRFILEEYVFEVDGGPHFLQSYFHVAQDNVPPAVKEMHLFFESLVSIDAPGLQTFFMDIHHDTSFRSILEDDSISSTSRAHIHFCLSKGARLWLIVKLAIYLFVSHHTFYFHFSIAFLP
jgi:hypothetical protein